MTWQPMGLMQKCLFFPMASLKIKLLAFFTEKIGSKHVFPDLWDTLYVRAMLSAEVLPYGRSAFVNFTLPSLRNKPRSVT